MKQSPLISQLSLYDIAHVKGVAADLSHIETQAQVTAHLGPGELAECLSGANVVIIPAGMPRKPGKLTGLSSQTKVWVRFSGSKRTIV